VFDQLIALIPLVHAGAKFMTGLTWFVQIVHYRLIGVVPAGKVTTTTGIPQPRVAWSRGHQKRV
jgi:hypothetical protein